MNLTTTMSSASDSRYDRLKQTTQSLCAAFARTAPVDEVARLFVSSPRIIEHGPSTPSVPFLSTFSGETALIDYMSILARLLTVSDALYSEPIIDVRQNMVSVKGGGRFTWQDGEGKGIAWDEDFVYLLSEFDAQGRIGKWEIWADPLNAWLASQARALSVDPLRES